MNESLAKIVKQKMDLETEIYSFQKFLKITDSSIEKIRQNMDSLTLKQDEIAHKISNLKDSLENLSNSNAFDTTKITQMKKIFAECKLLEQLLKRNYTSTIEKLKTMHQKKTLNTGSSVIQMDEQMQEKFVLLSNQEDLIHDANTKTEQVISTGLSILSDFNYQKQKSKSVIGGLQAIGKDLSISKWTSNMINKRFDADKRLIVTLFVCSIVFVLLGKYLLRN